MARSSRAEALIRLILEIKAEYIVEVGVGRGRLTRDVLESECSEFIREYWAIDPWSTEYSRDWYRDQAFFDKEAWDVYRYMCFFHQLRIIRMTSVEASKIFHNYMRYKPDRYFDIVFIDANHDYNSVKEDILHWKPLVKKSGIICGHDYARREKGVIQAVDEIFNDSIEIINPGSVWVKRV